jgi:hypothetical protein
LLVEVLHRIGDVVQRVLLGLGAEEVLGIAEVLPQAAGSWERSLKSSGKAFRYVWRIGSFGSTT